VLAGQQIAYHQARIDSCQEQIGRLRCEILERKEKVCKVEQADYQVKKKYENFENSMHAERSVLSGMFSGFSGYRVRASSGYNTGMTELLQDNRYSRTHENFNETSLKLQRLKRSLQDEIDALQIRIRNLEQEIRGHGANITSLRMAG